MVTMRTKKFKSEVKKALKNTRRRNLVRKVVDARMTARDQVVQTITPEVWEKQRERARAIKAEAMAHLDYYLDEKDNQDYFVYFQ